MVVVVVVVGVVATVATVATVVLVVVVGALERLLDFALSSASSSSFNSPSTVTPVTPLRGTREEKLVACGCQSESTAEATRSFFWDLDATSKTYIKGTPVLEYNIPSLGSFAYIVNEYGEGWFEALAGPPGTPLLDLETTAVANTLILLHFPVAVIPWKGAGQDLGGTDALTLRVLAAALNPALHHMAQCLGSNVAVIISDAFPVVAPPDYACKISKKTGGKLPVGWEPLSTSNTRNFIQRCAEFHLNPLILSRDSFKNAFPRTPAPTTWKATEQPQDSREKDAFGSSGAPFATFTVGVGEGIVVWTGFHPCARFFQQQMEWWSYCIQKLLLESAAGATSPLLDLTAQCLAAKVCDDACSQMPGDDLNLAARICGTQVGCETLKKMLQALPPLVLQSLHLRLMFLGNGGMKVQARMKASTVAAELRDQGKPLTHYQGRCLEEQRASGAYSPPPILHTC